MRALCCSMLLVIACGGAGAKPPATAPGDPDREATGTDGPAGVAEPKGTDAEGGAPLAGASTGELLARPGAQELDGDTSFEALLRLVRAVQREQQTGRAQAPDGPCLFTARDARWLVSGLRPAIQQLPEPAPQLAPLLRDHLGPIRVLTLWGQQGSGAGLALAALSYAPPATARLPVSAAVLTGEGIYLRHGDRDASPTLDGPLEPEAAAARLDAILGPSAGAGSPPARVLHVAAEAAVPLRALLGLVRVLPDRLVVGLAQVLPAGTQLPTSEAPPPDRRWHCPDGLPAPGQEVDPGDLSADEVRSGLAPAIERARECFSRVQGPAAAGGALELQVRIGAGGAVEAACLGQDGLHNAALSACVLDAATASRFRASGGIVDVRYPLRFDPQAEPPPRALCE